jgi:hypothetical protein
MALTIANLVYTNGTAGYEVSGTLAFDSSYPTGGETLTAANLGLAQIDNIQVQPRLGLVFEYDYTNSLLLVYEQGFTTGSTSVTTNAFNTVTGAAIEDAADAETTIFNASITTAIDTSYRTGKLVQCANTTNLVNVTGVRFRAAGV